MTLPTDLIFPMNTDLIKAGDPESMQRYLTDLTESLTEMYRQVAENVNGSIKFTQPAVAGNIISGTGTYTRQVGAYLRQGILVDFWFDIEWSAHTGTGGVVVKLPYKVAKSQVDPWVGNAQTSNINLGAGYTTTFGVASQNTFNYAIIRQGSAVPIDNITLPASGRVLGHARYIGQEFEN